MPKKHKGGGMSSGRKWIRRIVSWGGKAVGAFIILSPVIRAVQASGGDLASVPGRAAYNYSGVNIETGAINQDQAVKGATTVIVGVLIAAVLSYAARRF